MTTNILTLTLRLHPSTTAAAQMPPQTLEAEIDVSELTALIRQALTTHSANASRGLLAFAQSEIAHFARLVDNGRSRSSLAKYAVTLRHLTRFVQQRYAADRPLSLIDTDFVVAFIAYLRHDRHLADGTTRLYLVALKSWLRQAARQHLLPADPFYGLRLPPASRCRQSLTTDELQQLRALVLHGTAQRVRALFLLACYTGLSYADLLTLQPADIERSANDAWLTKARKKNGQFAVVPLLPEALCLIDRLVATPATERPHRRGWLGVPKNETCNAHLRAFSEQLHLSPPIHFHTSRHTFATILLTAGVPIETVSLMLGHARIATTQIYAAVTRQKIAHDTAALMPRALLGRGEAKSTNFST